MNSNQSNSVVYYHELSHKHQRVQVVLFSIMLLVFLPFVILSWLDNYSNVVNAPELIQQRSVLTMAMFLLLIPLVAIRNTISVVGASNYGLELRGVLLLRSQIPWSAVVDIWEYETQSQLYRKYGRNRCLIRIRSGLSIFHRSLPRKERGKWCWLRGFYLASAGQGYSEIIEEIEKHVGKRKDLRTYSTSD